MMKKITALPAVMCPAAAGKNRRLKYEEYDAMRKMIAFPCSKVAPTEPFLHPRTDFCTQMHPM